ncbi:hypothetical protein BBJ29_005467 [Phytophthora kernoviae]|uniref:Cyclic nucleotide-binding domain-containing protein n=1 Tax=Phytophthora kernoviae TaxID=325452 RepID=A0A3F2RHQ3_9STRA|nr:hypothetical protein BBP00_00007638 [Phytophthora kernoviae]RLN70009.1 hypothetical protein BBJ29_005467 [Phytophthora kernoviae]
MKESVEFINLLALALVRRVYSPGDQVTEPKFNAQMFFVIRGKVVLSAFDGSNSKDCGTGDFFADSCLLFPEKYEEKAVAKTFCELYVLAKAKFDEALIHFHRGDEPSVRARMTETLEKYSTQLRKTKKLLGLRGGNEDGGETSPLEDPASTYTSSFAYLRSVYWAIVALTGVGYGDIVAYSTAESYFAALWIFIGGIINFAATMGKVIKWRHMM